MRKVVVFSVVVVIVVAALISMAGNAVDSFESRVDTSQGAAGAAYKAKR